MREYPLEFESGELTLEGILSVPDGEGKFPAVIICHPHPLYGGDMNNNVVMAVSDALLQAGIIILKFNFRGVGRSGGSFDNGRGEGQDVRAAVSLVAGREEADAGRIGLAGYSAGAAFGLPVACKDERIKAIAGISPPLSMSDFAFLDDCPKPVLLIAGSEDNFTPARMFREMCRRLPASAEHYLITGADHFWWEYEDAMAEKVTAFFTRELKTGILNKD